MPRTSNRGGARQGTPGVAHSNRTDLNQPKQAATGQAYGQAGEQKASQQVVPLPNNAAQMAAMVQSAQQTQQHGAPVAGPSVAPAGVAPAPTQAPSGPFPGELGDFHRPSEFPHLPVTDGSPSGPGAGPEALMASPTPNIAQTIAQIAAASGNPTLQALAQKAAGGN